MPENGRRRSDRMREFIEGQADIVVVGIAAATIVGAAMLELLVPARSLAAQVPSASLTADTPRSFVAMIEQVEPAVVSIKVHSRRPPQLNASSLPPNTQGLPTALQELFRKFRGLEGLLKSPIPEAVTSAGGTGFFASEDGYIITTHDVVAGAAKLEVVTSDGRSLPAKMIGSDAMTDLAVLKVEGSGFPYVRFAQQSSRVGEWVVAVGNRFGLGETASAGILSASGRDIGQATYDNFLQIDTPADQGNAGRPMFNSRGEVIGVDTKTYSSRNAAAGVSFAVPTETVQMVYSAIKEKGSVTRGALSFEVQSITYGLAQALGTNVTRGALVDDVQANGAAAKAGLQTGDVIVMIDGVSVQDAHDLARRVAAIEPGTKVAVTYRRNGEEKSVEAVLDRLTGPAQQADKKSDFGSAPLQLGISLAPLRASADGQNHGVVVAGVDAWGLAVQQGIKRGDVILEIDGRKVNAPRDVSDDLRAAKADHKDMALIRLESGGRTHFIAMPAA